MLLQSHWVAVQGSPVNAGSALAAQAGQGQVARLSARAVACCTLLTEALQLILEPGRTGAAKRRPFGAKGCLQAGPVARLARMVVCSRAHTCRDSKERVFMK